MYPFSRKRKTPQRRSTQQQLPEPNTHKQSLYKRIHKSVKKGMNIVAKRTNLTKKNLAVIAVAMVAVATAVATNNPKFLKDNFSKISSAVADSRIAGKLRNISASSGKAKKQAEAEAQAQAKKAEADAKAKAEAEAEAKAKAKAQAEKVKAQAKAQTEAQKNLYLDITNKNNITASGKLHDDLKNNKGKKVENFTQKEICVRKNQVTNIFTIRSVDNKTGIFNYNILMVLDKDYNLRITGKSKEVIYTLLKQHYT